MSKPQCGDDPGHARAGSRLSECGHIAQNPGLIGTVQ